MVRMRSPNFPGLPLDAAVRAMKGIYDKNRRAVIMREDAAKDLGYSGLTGRSLKILGALNQYDLIENVSKGQIRVTKTGEDILHGIPEEVKIEALHRAGNAPPLFQAIFDRFEGDIPGENAVRSFLFQKGFTNEGVEKALRNFMATNHYLEISGATESHREDDENEREMVPLDRQEDRPTMQQAHREFQSAAPPTSKSLAVNFDLRSVAVSGSTSSARELRQFIDALAAIADFFEKAVPQIEKPDDPTEE
jgi:hypothetical protein